MKEDNERCLYMSSNARNAVMNLNIYALTVETKKRPNVLNVELKKPSSYCPHLLPFPPAEAWQPPLIVRLQADFLEPLN